MVWPAVWSAVISATIDHIQAVGPSALTACAASGPCDANFKTDAVAVTSMPPRVRSEAAAALLIEDCALPDKVEAARVSFQSAPPDYGRMLDMALATDTSVYSHDPPSLT